ncbi:hypothetical protein GCM10009584_15520 [Ornithinimicrobium humiphilum]|uniref:Uncharacterized protein n=1 Tax=Ornithinimicrobium humiphilum TaxID=125288 RepID=A0A543KKP9_9MICO|nr:hypothetical protein [Ornithinimicrobium humiphilum]TQM95644.1 hypothetical protein FB476_0489 [Ornithinimicrobium humiphilum]
MTRSRIATQPSSRPGAVGRRSVLLGAAATGAVTLAGPRAALAAESPASDPATRKPVLVGANPGLQLFDEDGACTAYASVWRVDWSPHGTGDALVLWQPDGVTVCSSRRELARWVTEDFTRHFPELDGLPWHDPVYRPWPVLLHLGLADGLVARAGTIEVRASGVLDVRSFTTDTFDLGGSEHSLHLVLGPCAEGSVRVGGRRLPGQITRGGTPERPSSSAFVTEAEVWRV